MQNLCLSLQLFCSIKDLLKAGNLSCIVKHFELMRSLNAIDMEGAEKGQLKTPIRDATGTNKTNT